MGKRIGKPSSIKYQYIDAARLAEIQKVRQAKDSLKKVLNRGLPIGSPKYAVGFIRNGSTYILQVRAKSKRDLASVPDAFNGYLVEKATLNPKPRLE